MMVQRLVLLLLVMLIVCLGCGKPMQKLKKITWTKDGAEMAFVPGRSMKALDTYDQFGDTIPGGILQERDAFLHGYNRSYCRSIQEVFEVI